MKKLWALVLCFVLLLSMTACGKNDTSTSADNKYAEAVQEGMTEEKKATAEVEGTEEGTEASVDLQEESASKTAVVCFSGTGNTMAIAEIIADVTDADLFEIIPAEKYTDEDLNYSDDNCRANKEQDDPDARPEIENDLSAVEGYDTIYLGHPIWWGTNPRIIQTFLDTYNLSNATIYTFCTSGGSGIEKSISDLQSQYPELNIVTGKRLNNATEADVTEWISSLGQ